MTINNEGTVLDPSVEELVFLARSQHRIQLLTQLSREERSRRDLQDTTEISQPTLGRILGDFERRHWISNNHDGTYALTPLGVLLADAVEDLLGVLDTINQLTALADHLPLDHLEFDLHHFSTSTILTPTSNDPLAHMRRFDELAAGATTVKMFSNVVSCAPTHDSSDADRELLTHVDELIVTGDAIADLNDSELKGWLSKQIDDGELSLYRYDDSAIFLLGIFDGTVGIVPIDDAGMPCGLIEAETAPIRTWANEIFEEYRQAATQLTPEVSPV